MKETNSVRGLACVFENNGILDGTRGRAIFGCGLPIWLVTHWSVFCTENCVANEARRVQSQSDVIEFARHTQTRALPRGRYACIPGVDIGGGWSITDPSQPQCDVRPQNKNKR